MTTNGFLGRDELLAYSNRRFKEVPLSDGRKVRIRSITEAEWADIDIKTIDAKKGGLSLAGLRQSDTRLVIACVCDGDGNPLFRESDSESLSKLDAAVFVPLVREIKEHCGLRGGLDDQQKNLNATGGDGSQCSSPALSHTP